ncbi:MAG: hypothetical protein H7Z72_01120 [Bacteroidetes bacterium]|nr:hypothetical protein [Fibrella sp.]
MRNKLSNSLILLALLSVWTGCRNPAPDVVTPTPVPPASAPDLLKQDPASLIEGVYTGFINAGGIVMPDGQLLIKRLDTRRINILSVYGLMVPYSLNVTVNKDTIQALPNQQYSLNAIVQGNKPVDFEVSKRLGTPFTGQPELFGFAWSTRSTNVEFRPLSVYRSVPDVQPSLHFLTGIYNGQYPIRGIEGGRPTLTRKAVVIRQLSSDEIELTDVNRWRTPIRLSVKKNETDSTWTGENNSLKVAFTINKGQPQRFTIQSKTTTDTTNLLGSWPPIHYEYDSRKSAQKQSFISL